VEPTSHATFAAAPLREDVARPSLPVEKGLSNAPARGETSFAVPKILE
ncbi:MAG: Asp-tRNA(Asn)/Glu-tRNA(Gln) amidotransferase subunit GatC, partial [Myxococcaceae bacterium]